MKSMVQAFILCFSFLSLAPSAFAQQNRGNSKSICNLPAYREVVLNLLKINDSSYKETDNTAASVGGHGEYFNSNVYSGMSTVTEPFTAMNITTQKTLDGVLLFDLTYANGQVVDCKLRAILKN